jgi:purine-binding chemotaxis protein CheW
MRILEETIEYELDEYEDTQKDKYFIFTVGDGYYGLEVSLVTEIIGIQQISKVPEVPDYIIGLINLRGMIIPIMDIRLRFQKEYMPYNDRTCIVIADYKEITIGFIVDSVTEVVEIPKEEMVYEYDLNKTSNRFLKGIGKNDSNVYMILDCEQLLRVEIKDEIY